MAVAAAQSAADTTRSVCNLCDTETPRILNVPGVFCVLALTTGLLRTHFPPDRFRDIPAAALHLS